MQTVLDERRRRAAYRASHRGTKEMDWLLGRYAEAHLAGMSDADLDLFEQLIQQPDPTLQAQIMGGPGVLAREFDALIAAIKAFHGIGATTGQDVAANAARVKS